MAAARAPHGNNQPTRIIVKKIYIEGGSGHHGGAWKVAYADFVTAMMAFFLLLWLLGATNEQQRRGIADYFAPTLVQMRQNSAGSNGMFGGESIVDRDHYPHAASGQTNQRSIVIPADATGGPQAGAGPDGSLRNPRDAAASVAADRQNFEHLRRRILDQITGTPQLSRLANHVHFVRTREGLRIDLIDNADYSMFAVGTTVLEPAAASLIGIVARSIAQLPNPIMIRGHTDSLAYGDPVNMNNWMLSSGRAEATRRRLAAAGIPDTRFSRIEGVADREPMIAGTPADPRNRRIALTLLYRAGSFAE